MLDKIINRSSKDIQDIQIKLHSTAKTKTRVSFPKLIQRYSEHGGIHAISKSTFSHLSVHLNWINNWIEKN